MSDSALRARSDAAWVVQPLSAPHLYEIGREIKQAFVQLAQLDIAASPVQVVDVLERSYVMLRSRAADGLGQASTDIARLGFLWAHQVVRQCAWSWKSVSADARPHPAIVSPDLAHVCFPVDLVATALVEKQKSPLKTLYQRIAAGPLPPAPPGALRVLL
ncbi:MAG: hypothetical protein K1X64_14335 [Myxococcaceae bacterium]|nr:hypothetical protein [Myxococcaceae bacterium]